MRATPHPPPPPPLAAARHCLRCDPLLTALDEARRQLLAPSAGGAYLARSTPRGTKRSVHHAALRLPRDTGEGFAPVPVWTLDLVWAGRRPPAGRVSAEGW